MIDQSLVSPFLFSLYDSSSSGVGENGGGSNSALDYVEEKMFCHHCDGEITFVNPVLTCPTLFLHKYHLNSVCPFAILWHLLRDKMSEFPYSALATLHKAVGAGTSVEL